MRTCSECGGPFPGKSVTAKTCSNKCRLRRSRRIRRANREVQEFAELNNAGSQEIAAIVRREAPDVITRVMRTELAPIVREALTEDVLRAIDQLVGLTPTAVAALQEDLLSDDKVMRQRAYTLLIKYTVGHPALVSQQAEGAGAQLVVNFGMPSPESRTEDPEKLAETEAVEFRDCDMCDTEKPITEFVVGSDRCLECFETWRREITEAYA